MSRVIPVSTQSPNALRQNYTKFLPSRKEKTSSNAGQIVPSKKGRALQYSGTHIWIKEWLVIVHNDLTSSGRRKDVWYAHREYTDAPAYSGNTTKKWTLRPIWREFLLTMQGRILTKVVWSKIFLNFFDHRLFDPEKEGLMNLMVIVLSKCYSP